MANLQGTHFQYSRFNNGKDPSPRAKAIINTSKEQRKSLIQADNLLHYSIHGIEPTHPEIKEIINSLKTIVNDSNLLKTDRLNAAKKLIGVGNSLGGDYQDTSIKIITTAFCECVESNDGTDTDTARTLKKKIKRIKSSS